MDKETLTKNQSFMLKQAFLIISVADLLAGCGQNGTNDRGATGTDTRSTYGSGSSSSTNASSTSQNAPTLGSSNTVGGSSNSTNTSTPPGQ